MSYRLLMLIKFKIVQLNLASKQFDLMSSTIRIKQKQNYQWNQDKKFLYVQIPLPAHTSLKKVDIYLSDLILRVNSLQKNQIHSLDLAQEVDYRSPDNKFILSNGLLHATLKKAQPDTQWSNLLVEDLSLFDLKKRREDSRIRYQQTVKSQEETKDKLRVDYDRKATQQLMRFEQEEREKLDEKKRVEKEDAIREVFQNVNEKTGKIQKKEVEHKHLQLQRVEGKWNQKERIALSVLEQQEEEERKKIQRQKKQKHQSKIIQEVKKSYQKQKIIQNNTMFTDQQIDKFEEIRQNINEGIQLEEVPIRKANNQTVKFTQRIFPNLAARDHFYKEPPMPKNKTGKSSTGDLQSKNPLWLKDKGDSFFKDKNFVSAIQAYSEALKIEPKLTNALLNRSLCYMKIFKLQEALNDCQQCLLHLQSQLSGQQSDQSHSKQTLAKIKTRKAICLAWKGELESSEKVLNEVLQLDLDEETKSQVNNCMDLIKKRQQSNTNKLKGDELVKINNHSAAISYYDRAIQIDQNQYATSNKVLCLNKCKDFKTAVEQAEKAIKKLALFNLGSAISQTKQDRQAVLILLKLYYRKAKALEQLGQTIEAEDNIRKGLTINAEDKDLQQYLKALKKKQAKETVKKLKEQSASLIKQSRIKQALQNYLKCLKLLQENQDIQQYLAILQNQCVCYTKLQMFDDVLLNCIRILKLVNSIQSKILGFGGKKDTNIIDKQELKKISVRTLVRRANAYIKTNQYYNAKSDLQKAYQINPEEAIRKELQNLKEKLKE